MIAAMPYAPPPELLALAEDAGMAETCYLPRFVGAQRADALLARAVAELDWGVERLRMFGRERTAPRLTAWYGEPGVVYRYSGVARQAAPWPPLVRGLAEQVAAALRWPFNYVLVNRYRNGRDMLGWHADDEADLGEAPVIASVSVGGERTFRLRPRRGGASVARRLEHGSLLLMWGRSQRDAKHCVPRTRAVVGERVNFTFRRVFGGAASEEP